MGGTHFLQTGYLLLNRNAPFGFIIYYDVTLKSIGKLKIITDVW